MLRRFNLPTLRLPPLGKVGHLVRELRFRLVCWWEGYDLDAYRHWAGARPGGDPAAAMDVESVAAQGLDRHGKPLWSATRIEVAEKLWGEGFVSPGGAEFIPELVKPLGLNPAMSVLDLHAELGGAARVMVSAFGTWITGLEPNPLLAAEGMDRSKKVGMGKQAPIAPYDPNEFKYGKRVDCIFAKELFFSVENKDKFLDALERALKPRGQFLFTDYVFIQNPGPNAALDLWRSREPMVPHPWTVAQYENALRQRNLDLRVSEDVTEMHKGHIMAAIQTLYAFIEKHEVEAHTKQAVKAEVELWGARLAAIEAGLRLYRFYALKPSS